MAQISISEYRNGIQALQNLMDMLYAALVEVMPSADLARTGAHGWRGYVIRKYRDLAGGQFFCQIYTDKPNIVLMEEFYNYSGFFYPWRVDHDLIQKDFFDKDAMEQKAHLVEFIREAVNQALQWQNSKERQDKLPKKVLNGRDYITKTHLVMPKHLRRVSPAYIEALNKQSELFHYLREQIETVALELGLRKPYTQYNQGGWGYRGLWMKTRHTEPDDVKPAGSFPFKWKIEFSNPTKLLFEGIKSDQWLDLEKHDFFALDQDHQIKALKDFIKSIMVEI